MPEWSDDALILSVSKFSERDGVVVFLSRSHGKCSGLCKGAFSKRQTGVFQTGNLVSMTWNARLEEHLGTVRAELLKSLCAPLLNDADRLTGLSCICAMLSLLAEREDVGSFFEETLRLIADLEGERWAESYALWEIDLLNVLGFGLNLSSCTVTGTTEDLIYVSPKTGCAVCATAGEPWKDKLLQLPAFLLKRPDAAPNGEEIKKALKLTGFFLENHVAKTLDCTIPAVRSRLVGRF